MTRCEERTMSNGLICRAIGNEYEGIDRVFSYLYVRSSGSINTTGSVQISVRPVKPSTQQLSIRQIFRLVIHLYSNQLFAIHSLSQYLLDLPSCMYRYSNLVKVNAWFPFAQEMASENTFFVISSCLCASYIQLSHCFVLGSFEIGPLWQMRDEGLCVTKIHER